MAFVKGIRNKTVQPLYDSVIYAAAGQVLLRFFAVPVGQGVTAVGPGAGPKHLGDTNMQLAGTLQNPYQQWVYGFRMATAWNIPRADLVLAFNAAAFVFTVGAKPFLEIPARNLPAGNGPYLSGVARTDAAATDVVAATSGEPKVDNCFKIGREPVHLTPTESFNAELRWAAVQALSAAASLTLYLDGVQYRGAQ